MTGIDSLVLKIKIKDLRGDIIHLNAIYSGWIEEEGNELNGEIGVFKSETGKDPITEFVGLRAKMYSFITKSNQRCT